MEDDDLRRILTGIPGLDQMIEGGFQINNTIMVRGGTGTGKTLFGLQYLYYGASKKAEPAVLISFAENKDAVYQHGKRFGWNFAELEKKDKFVFIKYAPHEVVKIMDEGGGTIRDTVEAIGAKRLVIDSLTAYAILFENEYRANESILDLFEMLRSWKCTTVVTSEKAVYPTEIEPERLGFLTDAIINLYYLTHGTERVRSMEVIKMRDTHHSNKMAYFDIMTNGLMIKTKEKVHYDAPYRHK